MKALKTIKRNVARSIRFGLREFLQIPPNYVGDNGCIRAAANYVAANQIAGDYIEFGVWKGYSFLVAYESILSNRESHFRLGFNDPAYSRWKAEKPRFFAFDSFQGLPETRGEKIMVDYGPGAYACSLEEFETILIDANVDLEDVICVEGYYQKTCVPETRKQYGLEKAAIVMIDCDLYESTVPVLNFLTEIVQQGTVIVFDDWFRFQGDPGSGEQRACREWLEANPQLELIEFWRQGPQAVSFIVNKR